MSLRVTKQTKEGLYEAYLIMCKIGEKKPLGMISYGKDMDLFLKIKNKKYYTRHDAVEAMYKVYLSSIDLYK